MLSFVNNFSLNIPHTIINTLRSSFVFYGCSDEIDSPVLFFTIGETLETTLRPDPVTITTEVVEPIASIDERRMSPVVVSSPSSPLTISTREL